MTALSSMVADIAQRRTAEVHHAIETAVEQALQLGDRGVLVLTRDGIPTRAGPHPAVPYGTIHNVPEEALDDYLANTPPRETPP